MTLAEKLSEDGRRLFGARSVVPLALLPVFFLAMPESWRVEHAVGAGYSSLIQWMALSVAFAGLLLRCVTVAFAPDGTSSRDTHRLRAPSLNCTGMYSIVRHPLYLGSALMWVGVAMSLRVWWLVLIVALVYAIYVERLMFVEEAYLRHSFADQFQRWAARTPAFVPRFSAWQPPVGGVQFKRVLSEHNGLLGIAITFPLLQFLEDFQHGGEPWAKWYSDHSDLVALLGLAVVLSALSIFIRRSADRRSPVELESHVRAEEAS